MRSASTRKRVLVAIAAAAVALPIWSTTASAAFFSFNAGPVVVNAGGTVNASSGTGEGQGPCPMDDNPFTTDFVALFLSPVGENQPEIADPVLLDVDEEGHWAGSIVVPPGTPPGVYDLEAFCVPFEENDLGGQAIDPGDLPGFYLPVEITVLAAETFPSFTG